MTPITVVLLGLVGGLAVFVLVSLRGRKGGGRQTGRHVAARMRQFGRRHPDFVFKLVRENAIQNVILYRFIDGYLEEGGYRTPVSKAEEARLMSGARSVIRELLTEPPLGVGVATETLEDALEAWRRAHRE